MERGIDEQGWVIIDNRPLEVFINSHIRGSQFISREHFSDFAGSFLEPEEKLILVAEDLLRAHELLISLRRIGIDHVIGFIDPQSLVELPDTLKGSIQTRQASALEEHALKENRVILDVRKAAEREDFKYHSSIHFPHARSIPDQKKVPEASIVTHCQTGLRAGGVASYLLRKGWQDVQCALGAPLLITSADAA